LVRSVEPVSTTTISSTNPATDARQAGRVGSSFLTMRVREILAVIDTALTVKVDEASH
jgi:hypothetical protein